MGYDFSLIYKHGNACDSQLHSNSLVMMAFGGYNVEMHVFSIGYFRCYTTAGFLELYPVPVL